MLDKRQVDAIRQAELANVVKKVKAGRTLTASDRKLLASQEAKSPEPVEELHSVNALGKLLGKDRRTVDKILVGVKPAGKRKGKPVYRLSDAEAALGTLKGETYAGLRAEQIRQQTRESRERADILAMKKARDRGETILMSEVQAIFTEALLPIRQAFLSMPAELATRVNPTDPVFAREAAQAWSDERIRMIREKLPQPKAAKEKGEE